jgi:hypothetical protein
VARAASKDRYTALGSVTLRKLVLNQRIRVSMRFGLAVARLASAAWVGAAVLFVVIAVREVRHPGFDSATKDTLALLRFPAYYVGGFILVSVALAGTFVALLGRAKGQLRAVAVAGWLLVLVLGLLVADYFAIYLPIVGMILPVGRARPEAFAVYHRASMMINFCDVALCALAAVLLCWHNPRDNRAYDQVTSNS